LFCVNFTRDKNISAGIITNTYTSMNKIFIGRLSLFQTIHTNIYDCNILNITINLRWHSFYVVSPIFAYTKSEINCVIVWWKQYFGTNKSYAVSNGFLKYNTAQTNTKAIIGVIRKRDILTNSFLITIVVNEIGLQLYCNKKEEIF
jgi:hypothetical protein